MAHAKIWQALLIAPWELEEVADAGGALLVHPTLKAATKHTKFISFDKSCSSGVQLAWLRYQQSTASESSSTTEWPEFVLMHDAPDLVVACDRPLAEVSPWVERQFLPIVQGVVQHSDPQNPFGDRRLLVILGSDYKVGLWRYTKTSDTWERKLNVNPVSVKLASTVSLVVEDSTFTTLLWFMCVNDTLYQPSASSRGKAEAERVLCLQALGQKAHGSHGPEARPLRAARPLGGRPRESTRQTRCKPSSNSRALVCIRDPPRQVPQRPTLPKEWLT